MKGENPNGLCSQDDPSPHLADDIPAYVRTLEDLWRSIDLDPPALDAIAAAQRIASDDQAGGGDAPCVPCRAARSVRYPGRAPEPEG